MIADDGFEWLVAVMRDGGRRCIVHDDPMCCELPLRGHHVITWQALRKVGRSDLRWATENGAIVCEGAHRRHHAGIARIRRVQLPPASIAFAEGIGLGYQIERYYPSGGDQDLNIG